MTDGWPIAEIDDIARLHLLAEGLPGAVVHERVLDRPFDEVWGFVSRLDEAVPRFDSDVRRLRIRSSEPTPDGGRHLDIVAGGPWWLARFPARFDVDLRDGWCWMVSRPQLYVVGMAAVPEGEGTRFAHLEGLTFRASGAVARLLAPVHGLSRWRHRRHIPYDIDGIERELAIDRAAAT